MKWIIIGLFLLITAPLPGQISLCGANRTDSLLQVLDTFSSNFQIPPITDGGIQFPDTARHHPSLARIYWQKSLLRHKSGYSTSATDSKSKMEAFNQAKRSNYLSSYFIIMLLMLALIISFLYVVRNRMKRKLAESELRNQKLASEQIQRELEGKQKDLTNLALEIARKNELFSKTNEMLAEINTSDLPADQQKKINRLIQYNTNQLRINEDVEELLVNIEQVNADFFEKLAEIIPDLTPAEKQLCALLRLNLGTKDIASIRNISPKSVEMARYRLRKKLPICGSDDIYAFVQNI